MTTAPPAAPRPPRLDVAARRRGLRTSIVEGLSAQSHSALTGLGVGGNAITTGFALLLGAGDVSLGLLAAIPPLSSTVQLLAAAVAPRLAGRKGGTVVSSVVARVLWLACGALPFVLGFGDAALAAFLVLYTLSCGLLAFSGNLWVSWMADLVPRRARATYFSRRNNACTVVGIVVSLTAGYTLDRWFGGVPDAAVSAAGQVLRAHGFALLFSVAAGAGLLCGALLRFQAEPPPRPRDPRDPREPLRGGLHEAVVLPFREALAAPRMRAFLLFVGVFGFVNGFAVPFWSPFMFERLHLPYTMVNGTFVIVQGVTIALALPVWGRLARRFGNRVVMLLALCLIMTHPLYYLIATPGRIWPVYCDQVSSGLAWCGYNLAIFNLALVLAPGPRPERAFAVYATVAGLSQAASSALSGELVAHMPRTVELLGHVLDRRQVVFLCTSVARAGCLVLFVRTVQGEAGGAPLRAVLAQIPYALKALGQAVGLPRAR